MSQPAKVACRGPGAVSMPLQRLLPGLLECGDAAGPSSVRGEPLAVPADDGQLLVAARTVPIARAGNLVVAHAGSRRPAAVPACHFAHEPRVGFGEQLRDGLQRLVQLRRGRAALRRHRSCAPQPPANAISATATASPPSLRSWQLRTSPGTDGLMQRQEGTLGKLRVHLWAPGHPLGHAAGHSGIRPVRCA